MVVIDDVMMMSLWHHAFPLSQKFTITIIIDTLLLLFSTLQYDIVHVIVQLLVVTFSLPIMYTVHVHVLLKLTLLFCV